MPGVLDEQSIRANYNLAKPDSLFSKIAMFQRRKMFARFIEATGVNAEDTILDIGATSDQSYEHSNYFEAWYPHKLRVTAAGIDDASHVESLYPGVRFVRANGIELPFATETFDYVHSNAVLEHVGSRDRQGQFLRETWRVARKGIFVTTPNRAFPVELHTTIPLLHWLPNSFFRATLKAFGQDFFAREENLNLLTRRSLGRVAHGAEIYSFRISAVTLMGIASNLLLIAKKEGNEEMRMDALS
jgi:ubiquinone/menaquinone biosynthesis C-methylase UbiE